MKLPRDLRDAVVDLLTLAEKSGLSFQKVDLDDEGGETINLYTAVLMNAGIEARDVERGAVLLLSKEKEFPKPATVLEYCSAARERRRSLETREYLRTLVQCVDENGYSLMAPRNRVRNGALLPRGDFTGDGSPAPKALAAGKPRDYRAEAIELRAKVDTIEATLKKTKDDEARAPLLREKEALETQLRRVVGVGRLMRDVRLAAREGEVKNAAARIDE